MPRPLTPLIGRQQELAIAVSILGDGQRLLTLTGPAGVGKTRLSVAIAEASHDLFSDDCVFVSLAPIVDSALVPGLVASAFDVSEPDVSDVVAALGARLGLRRVLLVIDNFEHLLSAAPLVSELLSESPGLSVLATSRGPLRVLGERVLPVPTLSLPSRARELELDDLGGYAAVQLFIDRARAASGDFSLTDQNAGSVVDICRELDGLPLAIELAAARLRVLSPQALRERLERGLQLLSGGARDAPPRLRTMRDAIAWSYALLAPEHQALFRRLGVFAGGWSLDAVEAVCLWDLGELDALDGLSSLIDQSLIRRAASVDGLEPRFDMLHVVREFALDRLIAAGEQEAVRRAHAKYFHHLTVRIGAARGADQEHGFARVSEELNNIRAIFTWALTDTAQSVDLDAALEMAGDLWFFWIHYMRAPGEARLWLTRAVNAAPSGDSPARGKALVALGAIEWRQGAYIPARLHLDESVEIFQQLEDAQRLGYALHLAGHVRFEAREYAEAQALYERSQTTLAEAGDQAGALPLIGDLGMVAYHQGDYERARTWFERCLRECRKHGVRDHAADSLNRLGDLARATGDLSRAESLYTESLRLWQSVNGVPGIASTLHKLAQTARRRGDIPEAHRLLSESLELQTDIGNQQGLVECLAALAGLAVELAPAERAVELLSAAEAGLAQLGAPLAPVDAIDLEQDRVRAQARIDTDAWAAAWRSGHELSVPDALALARSSVVDAAPNEAATAASRATGSLSPRELQVADLIAKGLSNREIATTLTISEKTAANHVEHIMTKLDLRSRAQIAVWTVQRHHVAAAHLSASPM